MFLSDKGKNKNTPDSHISESLKKLIEAVDQGLSYEEIQQKVIDPIDFARDYWMELYFTADNPQGKREAVLELRRLMLLVDGKNPLIN